MRSSPAPDAAPVIAGEECIAADPGEATDVGSSGDPVTVLDAAPAADAPLADAAPLPVDVPPASTVPTAQQGLDELEELTLPSSIAPPPALEPGAAIGPDGRLRIDRHTEARGRVNHYEAVWRDDTGQEVPAEVREAPADHAGLAREAEVLSAVRYTMLPRALASFEHEGKRYFARDRADGPSLEHALRAGMQPEQAISVVLQLVQALRRLRQAGWALPGLSPADVRLGQPLRIAEVGSAIRVGETPPHPLHVAGYSAPELVHSAPVTGKEEVYTLGAILFRALSGEAPPESGIQLEALPLDVSVPGGPQLLNVALAPADDRLELEEFYRRLLALKQRLTHVSVALEVASATTVGLNPSRTTNEDSCGYATWSVGAAEGVSYRALLCVADGMGGMEAGEVASRTALRTVLSAATAVAPPAAPGDGHAGGEPASVDPPLDLVALVERAATAVHAAAQGRAMGTTLTCVEVRDGELTLAHVGDTRAYFLREGVLTQLTADHSLVAAMVSSGVLTKEQARNHPESNKVLRSLGSQRDLQEGYVDTLEDAYGRPSLALRPEDRLLLCSDGVWGSVPDERIHEILSMAPNCHEAASALIELALQAGAPDNAAAVVARCVRAPSW